MLWLFCGFYFLLMCGASNYKVVFPFCFGFADAWGYDFPLFGTFVDAWEQKLRSFFLLVLWDLKLDFHKFLENLFSSMDAWGTTWKLFGFFCCNDAWGFDFQKVLWFLMVLLIQYGDLTSCNSVDAWGNNSPIFWHFGLC